MANKKGCKVCSLTDCVHPLSEWACWVVCKSDTFKHYKKDLESLPKHILEELIPYCNGSQLMEIDDILQSKGIQTDSVWQRLIMCIWPKREGMKLFFSDDEILHQGKKIFINKYYQDQLNEAIFAKEKSFFAQYSLFKPLREFEHCLIRPCCDTRHHPLLMLDQLRKHAECLYLRLPLPESVIKTDALQKLYPDHILRLAVGVVGVSGFQHFNSLLVPVLSTHKDTLQQIYLKLNSSSFNGKYLKMFLILLSGKVCHWCQRKLNLIPKNEKEYSAELKILAEVLLENKEKNDFNTPNQVSDETGTLHSVFSEKMDACEDGQYENDIPDHSHNGSGDYVQNVQNAEEPKNKTHVVSCKTDQLKGARHKMDCSEVHRFGEISAGDKIGSSDAAWNSSVNIVQHTDTTSFTSEILGQEVSPEHTPSSVLYQARTDFDDSCNSLHENDSFNTVQESNSFNESTVSSLRLPRVYEACLKGFNPNPWAVLKKITGETHGSSSDGTATFSGWDWDTESENKSDEEETDLFDVALESSHLHTQTKTNTPAYCRCFSKQNCLQRVPLWNISSLEIRPLHTTQQLKDITEVLPYWRHLKTLTIAGQATYEDVPTHGSCAFDAFWSAVLRLFEYHSLQALEMDQLQIRESLPVLLSDIFNVTNRVQKLKFGDIGYHTNSRNETRDKIALNAGIRDRKVTILELDLTCEKCEAHLMSALDHQLRHARSSEIMCEIFHKLEGVENLTLPFCIPPKLISKIKAFHSLKSLSFQDNITIGKHPEMLMDLLAFECLPLLKELCLSQTNVPTESLDGIVYAMASHPCLTRIILKKMKLGMSGCKVLYDLLSQSPASKLPLQCLDLSVNNIPCKDLLQTGPKLKILSSIMRCQQLVERLILEGNNVPFSMVNQVQQAYQGVCRVLENTGFAEYLFPGQDAEHLSQM